MLIDLSLFTTVFVVEIFVAEVLIVGAYLLFLSRLNQEVTGCTSGILAAGVFLGIVQLKGDSSPLSWICENSGLFAAYACGYFLVGVAWSFGKWALFLSDTRVDYEAHRIRRTEELAKHGKLLSPESFGIEVYHKFSFNIPIVAVEHRARICQWVEFWPISVTFTVFNLTGKLSKLCFNLFSSLYQKISDYILPGSKPR